MSGHPIRQALAVVVTAALLIAALAVPVMAGDDKVTICHKPGTNAEGTLEVAPAAVDAHLAHGDFIGACGCANGGDACTYLTMPDWNAVYAEHGCVRLDFVGDEQVVWYTPFLLEFEEGFTVTVDGVAYDSPYGIGPDGHSVVLHPDGGTSRVSWGTDEQVDTQWHIMCGH